MLFSSGNWVLRGRSFRPLWCPSLLPKSSRQTVKGLPTRLSYGTQLQHGQDFRPCFLVCGVHAQDSTLFKSPWPIDPCFSVLSSSHGHRSIGQMGFSSYSSVSKKPSSSVNAVEQSIEQLWEEYFVDPSQWWDNRAD